MTTERQFEVDDCGICRNTPILRINRETGEFEIMCVWCLSPKLWLKSQDMLSVIKAWNKLWFFRQCPKCQSSHCKIDEFFLAIRPGNEEYRWKCSLCQIKYPDFYRSHERIDAEDLFLTATQVFDGNEKRR